MIYLFSGTPGSGKSYHMAREIYTWITTGHCCICNFDIDITAIKRQKGRFIYIDNEDITPEFLERFSKLYFSEYRFREGALRLYLDECQLLFNCREWNVKGRKEWMRFFTQHRKLGYDIFLVAQFDRMIDRQIRCLIEYEYIHRKASNYGFLGGLLKLFAINRPMFVAVKMWYPMKERLGSEWMLLQKKYTRIYDTYNIFDEEKNEIIKNDFRQIEIMNLTGEAAAEASAGKR